MHSYSEYPFGVAPHAFRSGTLPPKPHSALLRDHLVERETAQGKLHDEEARLTTLSYKGWPRFFAPNGRL